MSFEQGLEKEGNFWSDEMRLKKARQYRERRSLHVRARGTYFHLGNLEAHTDTMGTKLTLHHGILAPKTLRDRASFELNTLVYMLLIDRQRDQS
jgi:hypothetical protein